MEEIIEMLKKYKNILLILLFIGIILGFVLNQVGWALVHEGIEKRKLEDKIRENSSIMVDPYYNIGNKEPIKLLV